MKSPKVRYGAAALAALVVAAVVGYFALGDDGRSRRAAPHSEAQEVAAALRRLTSDPQSLVAGPSRSLVGARAARAVPAGATVTPHVKSWQPDGRGGGVMAVTVKPRQGPSLEYAAVMVEEDTGWKVLGTMPVEGSASESGP